MTRVVSLDPPASATISANSTSKEASFDRTTTHAGNLEPNRKRKLASGLEEESKRTFALGEEEPTIDSNHNSTPVSSRRDSVPSHLRNQKMEATDCLLFAAILLDRAVEKEWSENSTHIPTLQSWCGSSTHIPSQPPPQLQKKTAATPTTFNTTNNLQSHNKTNTLRPTTFRTQWSWCSARTTTIKAVEKQAMEKNGVRERKKQKTIEKNGVCELATRNIKRIRTNIQTTETRRVY